MFVKREDLNETLLKALDEELEERITPKEKQTIVNAIIEYLDGEYLSVADEDEEEDFELEG